MLDYFKGIEANARQIAQRLAAARAARAAA
jgi:hypothetical protein